MGMILKLTEYVYKHWEHPAKIFIWVDEHDLPDKLTNEEKTLMFNEIVSVAPAFWGILINYGAPTEGFWLGFSDLGDTM